MYLCGNCIIGVGGYMSANKYIIYVNKCVRTVKPLNSETFRLNKLIYYSNTLNIYNIHTQGYENTWLSVTLGYFDLFLGLTAIKYSTSKLKIDVTK